MEEYIAELESLLTKHLKDAETTGNWVDYVKVKYASCSETYCILKYV